MNEFWGAIVDDLDVVLLGIFGGEIEPISIPPVLAHYFLVGGVADHHSQRLCNTGITEDSAN